MHAKILRPQTAGKLVYANRGSARRMTNYLQQEAKEEGREAVFFGAAGKGTYSADEVVVLLDKNHRGLGKGAEKFHSLVLSPSSEEASQLGSDPAAWQRYTRQVMDLYAKNFTLKGEQLLSEEDLVWAATIHQQRKNRGTDAGQQGEQKPGIQTHVHLLVSARDAAQQITLNPHTSPARFNRVEFHAKTNILLEDQLGVVAVTGSGVPVPSRQQRVAEKAADIKARAAANRKPLTTEQVAAKGARLDVQVVRVNTKLAMDSQLEVELVKAIANERSYDNTFYNALGKIERNAERGIFTPEHYSYLRSGRVQRSGTLDELPAPQPQSLVHPVTVWKEQPALPAAFQALDRSIQELSLALATASLLPVPEEVHREVVRSKAESPAASPMPFLATASLLPLEAAPILAAPAAQTPVVQDAESTPVVASPPQEKSLTIEEKWELWQAEMQAEAQLAFWDAGWDARLELEEKTREQVATAGTAAQRTGASFAFLLAGQGLELVTAEADFLIGVRHQASGELFSLDEVPVPAAARAVMGQSAVQYGSIHLSNGVEGSGEARLAHWHSVLAQAGVLVGQVVAAEPGRLARLDYCFPVPQLGLGAISAHLNILQYRENAQIYEAPHPLHAQAAPTFGHDVPRSQWLQREGQFNQARIVVNGVDPGEKQAEIIRTKLRDGGASVSTRDDYGNLELLVTFHTHADKIEKLNAMLDGAALLKGVELRETSQQRDMRYLGAQSKQVEPGTPSIFQREM